MLFIIDIDALPIGIELFIIAVLFIIDELLIGIELLVMLMLPCANTAGAAIPTIKDTAATILTIAIKFNLYMHT